MSWKRKIKRSSENKAKKDLAKEVGLFNRLPDMCLTCEKPFDKRDKEMVSTWNVVVNKQEKEVRLYCPDCWSMAKNLIKEIKDGYSNSKDNV